MRYLYLLKSSWPRALELVYWPTMQMILWGFTSQFLMTNSAYVARAAGVLLGAVLLWDVMFRGQLGVSVSFLEELWSRNLGQLFITPLRPSEWALSLVAMSLVRVLIGMVPAALLAIPLYHYSIFTLGLPLIAFFTLLLVMGWALGLVHRRRSCCATGSAPRASPGWRCSCWRRPRPSITRSRFCRTGCSSSPGRCRARMCSRGCAR